VFFSVSVNDPSLQTFSRMGFKGGGS